MVRIKIKTKHNPNNKTTKHKLLEILGPANIFATSLISTQDGILITTTSENEIDKILDPTLTGKLIEQGFSPIVPPEIKSKRTVICYKVEEYAFDNETKEIKEEINNSQDWASAQNCYKFPNNNGRRNMLKVEFATVQMADKACDTGIKMFNVSIGPHQIETGPRG